MVSYKKVPYGYREWYCLSTDTKPTEGVGNGDPLLEIDTGVEFRFDADGDQWCQVSPVPSEEA